MRAVLLLLTPRVLRCVGAGFRTRFVVFVLVDLLLALLALPATAGVDGGIITARVVCNWRRRVGNRRPMMCVGRLWSR